MGISNLTCDFLKCSSHSVWFVSSATGTGSAKMFAVHYTRDRECKSKTTEVFLFLSFRRVVNVICSFLGNSPASEI